MERRLFLGWPAILVLLVPLLFELPRQSSGAPFNYAAHCRDMDSGTNSLFIYTVREYQDRVADTYSRHYGTELTPPHGVNRLVRMFYRLREVRDEAQDIDQLVSEVEDTFLLRLERLERDCKRQIHG
ncbi:uncharacterized protein LOC119746265 [Patiria miniata]|uniref:Uncharacterized protein n=1 Tax=Patiria miniata TaxID=46514 RepID=A0A914BST1_PATMI|nr:uncharacterized protein LOC119746265 [Patiria miniata]